MLNLTMKVMDYLPEEFEKKSEKIDDVEETIMTMKKQENKNYLCGDYLLRRQLHQHNINGDVMEVEDKDNLIDEICRQKMCDWSYRIIDHFNGNRDIVFLSFNLLNRFLDRCDCDRTSFKLAAMTTLYLSLKMHSHKPISIKTFADLSRDEFEIEHIQEMEIIILQALSWQINAPTAATFIRLFHRFIPKHVKPSVQKTILQRSCFFSELSLFDYYFVTQHPSTIALSSIMNAVEGLEQHSISLQDKQTFCSSILKFNQEQQLPIELSRQRLWVLYKRSAQFQQHDIERFYSRRSIRDSENTLLNKNNNNKTSLGDLSPVSILSA